MIVRDHPSPLACITAKIAAPADAVWRVLTDFGAPQRLAHTILDCTATGSGVGAVRMVKSSRGLIIHERLTLCDRLEWRFQYEVLGSGDMPFAGLTHYRATVTLTPCEAAQTIVEWRAEGRVAGDASTVIAAIETLYRAAIVNLEREAQA